MASRLMVLAWMVLGVLFGTSSTSAQNEDVTDAMGGADLQETSDAPQGESGSEQSSAAPGEDTDASQAGSDGPATSAAPPTLLGDWWGARNNLANRGITFDLQWTQSFQGVVSGGRDPGWNYGGSVDLKSTLDLGKLELMKGGFMSVLVQGRYGESVISEAGTILPVNTDLYIPLTGELDDDIFAVTELLYTQFLSEHFAVLVGKMQTLDGDPNEFASGRGRSQFMNFSFVAPNLIGQAVPYSTLGVGVLVLPAEWVTISSIVMNTTDSSTTTGFDDIGDGTTWVTEADFQYRLGHLPGGQNIGFAYAFDNDFFTLNGDGLPGGSIRTTSDDTWSLYWSLWQYVLTLDDAPQKINTTDGRPDVRGLGVFARAGLIDQDTSLVEWSASVGLGGRGLIPTRDNDMFGIAFGYTAIETNNRVAALLLEDEAYVLEAFYNFMIAPGVSLTADVQVLEPAVSTIDTTVVTGVRLNVTF